MDGYLKTKKQLAAAAGYKNPDSFKADLQMAKSLTDRPISVNYTIIEHMGIGVSYHEPFLKNALDEGINIGFTTSNDGSAIGHRIKEAGGIWIHKCETLKYAGSNTRKGADAVVLVGLEGAGDKNPEQHTTLINITLGRRLLKIPIIAAGGIADGYGLAGALAMGASGVYMRTAFMATKEFPLPEKDKKKIVKQDITDGRHTSSFYKKKHNGRHSPASGAIDSILTVKELINKTMAEARESLSLLTDFTSVFSELYKKN
jgi:NAD(P)H-dependent flavin oxidoreductase YrpB (nitropropane dioxygenase family)